MADYQYSNTRGLVIPDTSVIRTGVEAEWKEAFGPDLDVSPDTVQGVVITAEIESRDGVVRNNAEVANGINPDLAGGVWLDAIWAITGGERRGATASRLYGVVFGGQPSTLIPTGSQASVQGTNEVFYTVSDVTLNEFGVGSGDMLSVNLGRVACPANALNSIAASVLGWETVTNPSSAILGFEQESDAAGRMRRRNTLALQGISISEAVTSRIYAIDGVRSLFFRENITNDIAVEDGISLVPHSVYACVSGGDEDLIAQALLDTKTVGANWNGSVLKNVIDQFSGQSYPVRFDRPASVLIYVRVTVRESALDVETIVRNAIINYGNGQNDGEPGFGVGEPVSPFELSGAINQSEPRIFVMKVELSTDGGITYSTEDVPVLGNQIAIVTSNSISVVSV